MAYIYATSKLETSITCEIRGLDINYSYSGRYVRWYYNGSYEGQSSIPAHVSSGGRYRASGLNPGTRYDIDANIYDSSGTLLASLSGTATTASPPKPGTAGTLTIQNITDTTVTVRLPSVSNADSYEVFYRLSTESSGKTVETSSRTCTVKGLRPLTDYIINYRGMNDSGAGAFGSPVPFTTLADRPSNWTWTSTEINAFNNKGLVSVLTYLRWNAFIDRIGNFVWYFWSPSNAQTYQDILNDAYMSSSDRYLTATKFNAVRSVIGAMRSTGITNKSPGDIVYGDYFISLSNALNDVIK